MVEVSLFPLLSTVVLPVNVIWAVVLQEDMLLVAAEFHGDTLELEGDELGSAEFQVVSIRLVVLISTDSQA